MVNSPLCLRYEIAREPEQNIFGMRLNHCSSSLLAAIRGETLQPNLSSFRSALACTSLPQDLLDRRVSLNENICKT